jgi:hypothetical protein
MEMRGEPINCVTDKRAPPLVYGSLSITFTRVCGSPVLFVIFMVGHLSCLKAQ